MFRLVKTKLALGSLPLVVLLTTAAFTQTTYAQNRDAFHDGVRDGQSGGQYSQDSRHSYGHDGYDQYGYDRDGYNRDGYNPSGYNRNGQRQQQAYSRNSYNHNGYDRDGNDRKGYNQSGYDRNSHDPNGRAQGDNRYGDQAYHTDDSRGGIGPGKGALIGGAGGAILGALFGGGLKGSLIGGAAGAGIGALVGKEHQNSQRRRNNRYPPQ